MLQRLLQKSIVRYMAVGVGSLIVDYAVLLALYHVLHAHIAVASAAGFILGLVVNFLLNKYWSFNAARGKKQSAKQAALYGVLVAVNLVFTMWFVSYMVAVGIGPELSKIAATVAITLWNFLLYKKLIFKEDAAQEPTI